MFFFFRGEELAPTREDDVSSAQGAPKSGADKISVHKILDMSSFGGLNMREQTQDCKMAKFGQFICIYVMYLDPIHIYIYICMWMFYP